MRAELAKVCTHAHVRCAHAHDMLRRNSRVVDACACRAVRLHSHKSFAHLESRDKLSDVIESSSSITCSCAVSIRGTPGAAPRQSRGNFWWHLPRSGWRVRPARGSKPPSRPSSHKRIFLSAQMATTCCPEWLTCSREQLRPDTARQDLGGRAEAGFGCERAHRQIVDTRAVPCLDGCSCKSGARHTMGG